MKKLGSLLLVFLIMLSVTGCAGLEAFGGSDAGNNNPAVVDTWKPVDLDIPEAGGGSVKPGPSDPGIGGGEAPSDPGIGGGEAPSDPGIGGGEAPSDPGIGGGEAPSDPGIGGGEETPSDPGIGGGEETPSDPGIGGGEETPSDPGIGGGEETPSDPGIGGGEAPSDPGIGGGEAPSDPEPEEPERPIVSGGWAATKTGLFYSQFQKGSMYLKLSSKWSGNTTAKFGIALKGDKIYLDSTVGGSKNRIIFWNGKNYYVLDVKQKIAAKLKEFDIQTGLMELVLDESKADISTMIKGEKTISKKTYETEEWQVGESTLVMCFNGEKPAYIVLRVGGKDIIYKIDSYSKKVNDSLFQVPGGYRTISI